MIGLRRLVQPKSVTIDCLVTFPDSLIALSLLELFFVGKRGESCDCRLFSMWIA